MGKRPDPYDILGVPHDADPEDVKKAFREKAKASHPDHGGTAESFALVKFANDVLSDSEKRAKFDETGEIDEPTPDTKDAHAMNLITGFLNTIIDSPQVDPITTDLVDLIVHHLKEQIAGIKTKCEQLKKPLIKAERIQKRFKRKKGKGPNFISRLLEQRIEGTKNVIAKLEAEIPTLNVFSGLKA